MPAHARHRLFAGLPMLAGTGRALDPPRRGGVGRVAWPPAASSPTQRTRRARHDGINGVDGKGAKARLRAEQRSWPSALGWLRAALSQARQPARSNEGGQRPRRVWARDAPDAPDAPEVRAGAGMPRAETPMNAPQAASQRRAATLGARSGSGDARAVRASAGAPARRRPSPSVRKRRAPSPGRLRAAAWALASPDTGTAGRRTPPSTPRPA